MTRVLAECDGVRAPSALLKPGWDESYEIRSQGPKATKTLRVQPLADALKGTVGALANDLVRIAAYMYWADQHASRGGATDVFGAEWRRTFLICAPVSNPDVWNNETTRRLLHEVAHFLTEDVWLFHFAKATFDEQLSLGTSPSSARRDPDLVTVFSGGADSLCATVEATLEGGRRPVLVSHQPSQMIDGRQKRLVQLLRERVPDWHFPHTGVVVNKIKTPERDSTQRTRSFLYGSLGVGVANALGLEEVWLADNGTVSLNLPINDQLVGALASRSTHPKFISRLNRLVEHVLDTAPVVSNPLWDRTRMETLRVLARSGLGELLQETNSCSRGRLLPNATPHCGACSQCIDRRTASLAAGMEQFDLAERYQTDVFRAKLSDNALTTAESYVRFARTVNLTMEEDLFNEYPQLGDCILADDPRASETAQTLAAMVKRHGSEVLRVLQAEIAKASEELSLGELPPTCLVRLAVEAEGEGLQSRAVQPIELSDDEEQEFRKHRLKSRVPIEVTGLLEGRKSNVLYVGDGEVIVPDYLFRIFLRLIVGLFEPGDGWVPLSILDQEEVVGLTDVYREIDRLRSRLAGALPREMNRAEFVQVSQKRVRISTHRRYVGFDRPQLLSHPDPFLRRLASRLPAAG